MFEDKVDAMTKDDDANTKAETTNTQHRKHAWNHWNVVDIDIYEQKVRRDMLREMRLEKLVW